MRRYTVKGTSQSTVCIVELHCVRRKGVHVRYGYYCENSITFKINSTTYNANPNIQNRQPTHIVVMYLSPVDCCVLGCCANLFVQLLGSLPFRIYFPIPLRLIVVFLFCSVARFPSDYNRRHLLLLRISSFHDIVFSSRQRVSSAQTETAAIPHWDSQSARKKVRILLLFIYLLEIWHGTTQSAFPTMNRGIAYL